MNKKPFVVPSAWDYGGQGSKDTRPGVSTCVRNKNTFGPQYNNIPSIIRGIKSTVTIQARKISPDFGWQTRYYDHIIRNRKDYKRILEYLNKHPRIVL